MLKKARSFKEDVKGLIKRRPSTSGSHGPGKPRIQINGGRGDARDPVSIFRDFLVLKSGRSNAEIGDGRGLHLPC